MDPPSYGRGPNGEMWKLENELYPLVELCSQVLSEQPLFFLINSYTTGLQPQVLKNILELTIKNGRGGKVEAYEVGLKTEQEGVILPCGNSGIWINGK
jgi:23S rRNA (cytosine1962-C5)-methyltransferase